MIAALRSSCAAAVALALALGPGTASAGPSDASPAAAASVEADREVMLVLPITTRGALAEHLPRALEQRLASGLRRGGATVVAADAAPAGACEAACLRELAAAAGAAYLVRAEVAVEGRDYDVRVTLLRASTGEVAVTGGELCEICGHEELGDRVDDLAAALLRKLPAVAVPPPRVTQAVPDAPAPVPAPPATVEAPQRRRLAPLGWAALAVGVGALGGGVALIAIDERPIQRDCSGANVDAQGHCKWRHATLEGGVGLAIAGVAAIAVGATLVLLDRRRGRRSAERATVRALGAGVLVHF